MMRRALFLASCAFAVGFGSAAFGAEIINEDFTDPAWQHPTDNLFNSPPYPLMVDGVNGWTVNQGLGLPSGCAIKARTDVLQYVNSFWENGSQSPQGKNPTGISRSDLPNLIDGDFSFGWRDGFGGHTYWQVLLKDCQGKVAATIRHGSANGNIMTVNGTPYTALGGYAANGPQPALVKVSWDINAGTVTLDELLDGAGGANVAFGGSDAIQNGAGSIITFEFTSGNEATGNGGGIEMVGSILGGTNDFGVGVTNGLIINGTSEPESDCVVASTNETIDDTFEAEFLSEIGTTYELECTGVLISDIWTGTGAFVDGNGANTFLYDPSVSSADKYYRVTKLPFSE
jgi:hypothetical protein